MGLIVCIISFEVLFGELVEYYLLYMMDKKGDLICDIKIGLNLCFILIDYILMLKKSGNLMKCFGVEKISFGLKMLFVF